MAFPVDIFQPAVVFLTDFSTDPDMERSLREVDAKWEAFDAAIVARAAERADRSFLSRWLNDEIRGSASLVLSEGSSQRESYMSHVAMSYIRRLESRPRTTPGTKGPASSHIPALEEEL